MNEPNQGILIGVCFAIIGLVWILEYLKAQKEGLDLNGWIAAYPLKAWCAAAVILIVFYALNKGNTVVQYVSVPPNWTPPLQNFTPPGWHNITIGNATMVIP